MKKLFFLLTLILFALFAFGQDTLKVKHGTYVVEVEPVIIRDTVYQIVHDTIYVYPKDSVFFKASQYVAQSGIRASTFCDGIGGTNAGDWIDYEGDITGLKSLHYKYSSIDAYRSEVQVLLNGVEITRFTPPSTGAWENIGESEVNISQGGKGTIRFNILGDAAFDLCDFWFTDKVVAEITPEYKYFVSTTGTDQGDCTIPCKTIKYAVTKVPSGETLFIGEGTFNEPAGTEIPAGVSIHGAGMGRTVIKSTSTSKVENGSNPLFYIKSTSSTLGNQTFSDFTIDGGNKALNVGVHLNRRDDVTFKGVEIKGCYFNGIYIVLTKNTLIDACVFKDNSWSSSGWSAGNVSILAPENLEIKNTTIDESVGYGIKNETPPVSGLRNLTGFKFHHNALTVAKSSLWNNGSPNISLEIWAKSFIDFEMYENNIDGVVSLLNRDWTSQNTNFKIYSNKFDQSQRNQNYGYGIELAVTNIELYDNDFIGGQWSICCWVGDSGVNLGTWNIHDNRFTGPSKTFFQLGLSSSSFKVDIDLINNDFSGGKPLYSKASGVTVTVDQSGNTGL